MLPYDTSAPFPKPLYKASIRQDLHNIYRSPCHLTQSSRRPRGHGGGVRPEEPALCRLPCPGIPPAAAGGPGPPPRAAARLLRTCARRGPRRPLAPSAFSLPPAPPQPARHGHAQPAASSLPALGRPYCSHHSRRPPARPCQQHDPTRRIPPPCPHPPTVSPSPRVPTASPGAAERRGRSPSVRTKWRPGSKGRGRCRARP